MHLMLIGTDRALFSEGSSVRERLTHLGSVPGDALDSIVFSRSAHGITASQMLAPTVHAYPTHSWSRVWYITDALRVAKRLTRPDLIAAQDPFETGLAALLIAHYFQVPFVVEAHTDFLSPDFARHSFLNRLRVFMAGFVLRRASGGNAVSKGLKERICAQYHLSIPFAVLPLYVDTIGSLNLPHVAHPRFTTTLLWVGRLEREKNPELAIRSLAAARGAGMDVGLVMVGGGSLEKALRRSAERLGVASWVEWVKWVKVVTPYYQAADLLLVTSKYEGYGMVIVEALAAGVPVLSTDVGIAREAGAIIAEGDYSEALLAWLSGPRERGALRFRPYENETDYLQRVRSFYASLAVV